MSDFYPIIDSIDNIFYVIQGHQITDEEIYKASGDIPIYTGPNQLKGFWNKSIVESSDLPCLTYATKAFDGTITVQNQIFDANNTAVLILKEKYKKYVLLEWAKIVLPNIFLELTTSKEGVSYLNKDIIKKIEISIPKVDIQEKIIKKREELLNKYSLADAILSKCKSLVDKSICFTYNKFQAKDIPVTECLTYMSGSSQLTEEKNYQRLKNEGERYKLLTGATNKDLGYVVIGESDEVSSFSDKEGLLVTRKGKAGQTEYLPPDKYVLNDDAYILFLKEKCKYSIDLRWFAIQYKEAIKLYASNSDNGTWNMTGFFRYTKIDIPSYDEQIQLV